MKKTVLICLFLSFFAIAYCGQVNRIELSDGTVINGEIISLADGYYTVRTSGIGEVKIAAEKILKIDAVGNASAITAISSQASGASGVSAYAETIMKNPANISVLSELAASPQIQAMAEDPQIQEAAKKGDIQALMANPRFMEMVNSQEMKEAAQKIKK